MSFGSDCPFATNTFLLRTGNQEYWHYAVPKHQEINSNTNLSYKSSERVQKRQIIPTSCQHSRADTYLRAWQRLHLQHTLLLCIGFQAGARPVEHFRKSTWQDLRAWGCGKRREEKCLGMCVRDQMMGPCRRKTEKSWSYAP